MLDSEDSLEKLVVNGIEIDNYKHTTDVGLGDDIVSIELPDYTLIEKKNSVKWIGDMDADDTEALSKILGIDIDMLINKKVRIIIQTLGPAKKKE